MAAPQPNTIADAPATPAACSQDYRPPAQAQQAAADARNDLGALGTGQQHTHRS